MSSLTPTESIIKPSLKCHVSASPITRKKVNQNFFYANVTREDEKKNSPNT